jgi:hypothetical protein
MDRVVRGKLMLKKPIPGLAGGGGGGGSGAGSSTSQPAGGGGGGGAAARRPLAIPIAAPSSATPAPATAAKD